MRHNEETDDIEEDKNFESCDTLRIAAARIAEAFDKFDFDVSKVKTVRNIFEFAE